MTYLSTVYDRIEEISDSDWLRVASDPTDLAMDRRLLGAFQSALGDQCRCWFVVFRDGANLPVAIACLALFQVDAVETTRPATRAVTRKIRRAFPDYMRFGVLFCGLPLPSGASHLRWIPGTDLSSLAASLDAVMQKLARQHRARLVVVKELDDDQIADLSGLKSRGYLIGQIPSNFEFDQIFRSFDEYFRALQSGYRKQITRSQKRFSKAGASIEVVTGGVIAERFTDEAHALYLATRAQAKYRMETLSADFFRETARRFGDDASLTLCHLDGRVVGWTFGIVVGHEYHDLYIGIDYSRNMEADVYFNLYYHDLDRIFRRGCTCVHLGQTSEEFKTRLGAVPRERWFYVRAVNRLLNSGLRRTARWVFPPVAHAPPRDIYLHAMPSKTKVPMANGQANQAREREDDVLRSLG